MKVRTLSAGVAAALLLMAGPALAITNVESNASIPFSFSNPGARSLAMGGAFIGAADDATAAFTNPAGLTRLGLEQQFGLEYRHVSIDTPYPAGGNAGLAPVTFNGVNYRNDSDTADDLAFVSWVLPQDTWAIAVYRHQTANFENGYSTNAIAFPPIGNQIFAVRPYDVASDLDIVSYGASFAMNLTDSLSFGVGAAWYDFELASLTERYNFNANLDRTTLANRQIQLGDDDDIAYNVGLLYKGSDRFSIGLTYRSGAKFSYRATSDFFPPDGSPTVRTADVRTPFEMPDVFGVGVSWRATDNLTFNLDVNRVGYSNLSEQMDDAFFAGGNFQELIDPQILRSIEIDDVIEPRLGVEYLMTSTKYPIAFRAGTWREEKHTLSFNGDPNAANFVDPVVAAANAVLFSAGEDQNHYSVGLGVVFSSFQLDFAYDTSDNLDTLSLSGVLRF